MILYLLPKQKKMPTNSGVGATRRGPDIVIWRVRKHVQMEPNPTHLYRDRVDRSQERVAVSRHFFGSKAISYPVGFFCNFHLKRASSIPVIKPLYSSPSRAFSCEDPPSLVLSLLFPHTPDLSPPTEISRVSISSLRFPPPLHLPRAR